MAQDSQEVKQEYFGDFAQEGMAHKCHPRFDSECLGPIAA